MRRHAVHQGSILQRRVLQRCILQRCILQRCILQRCILQGCILGDHGRLARALWGAISVGCCDGILRRGLRLRLGRSIGIPQTGTLLEVLFLSGGVFGTDLLAIDALDRKTLCSKRRLLVRGGISSSIPTGTNLVIIFGPELHEGVVDVRVDGATHIILRRPVERSMINLDGCTVTIRRSRCV